MTAKTRRKELVEILDSMEAEALTADGFDAAIIGVHDFGNGPVVIYDENAVLRVLEKQGMDEIGAREFYDFNVVRSLYYMGKQAPIFISLLPGLNVIEITKKVKKARDSIWPLSYLKGKKSKT